MPALDRPPAARAINGLGRLLQKVGLAPILDPDKILETAAERAGSADFGSETFLEGYRRLAEELDAGARLNTIGRLAARTRLLTLLETRQRLLDWRQEHPEVAAQSIERPIFVLGLPRTGTTVLYGLLAANPAMRSPTSWEVARPFPPPTLANRFDDPRIAETEKEFDQFRKVAPGIDRIHPLGAMLPQECMAMHALTFESYEFVTTFPVPSYWEWLRTRDLVTAYEMQRLFLQHLQSGYGGEHWILKTPGHLLWLDTLLEVFPDALIVQTHRNPSTVMASVSSLMYALRSAVSDHVDPHEVGRDQLDTWTWGLERTMEARKKLPAERVVDVHFTDTVNRPVETVARIYEHFGLELTAAVEQGVRDYLAENPRTKHGVHTYTLDEFGIDPDEADNAFAGYRERFGVDDG
ncbi:MAG: sulfotransferase [Nitriliruptorales bacterium]|nr:sulfotransferase [Nitriliruptorales bacterium]